MPTLAPQRGEVWMVDFGLAAKVRPAVVLSIPFSEEDRAILGVVPHTTSLRGSQFEVDVQAPFLDKEGAFLIQGFATLPARHFIKRLGVLNSSQLKLIEGAMRRWLAL